MPDPVKPGSSGVAVLPFLQYGYWDPSVVPTSGEPGGVYIQVPTSLTVPPGAFGLFQKSMNSNTGTDWTKFVGGSIAPSEIDYKNPVDTISAPGVPVNLAAPGNIINGVDLSMIVGEASFLTVDQVGSIDNGIYDWNGPGVPATRRPDAVNPLVQKGMFTWVNSGPTVRALSGWILTTPNPINVGVTPLVFANIPLATSQATRIAGLYWVASNGSDVVPATRGAIAAPFLTIQAAITQAIAEGHGTANPANVYVMAKGVPYAGFTTANGINVTGMAGLWFKNVTVNSVVTIAPDGTGFGNNAGNSISNLQIAVAAGVGLQFNSVNPGLWRLLNCRILTTDNALPALNFASVGSVLFIDNCNIINNGTGPASLVSAGSSEFRNFCDLQSQGPALRVGATANTKITGCRFNTVLAANASIDCFGSLYAEGCELGFPGSLGDGLYVQAGGVATVVNSDINVAGGAVGYHVFPGGTLNKSCISFSGAGVTFVNAGATNTIPLTGLGYTPATPANWPLVPTDVKPALDQLVTGAPSYQVIGTVGGPIDVTGLATIPFASPKMFTKIYISSTVPQVMAGPPEIAPATIDGQELLLANAGAQNITIPGVSGTSQNGLVVLVPGDQIKYSWDTAVWNEICRKQ